MKTKSNFLFYIVLIVLCFKASAQSPFNLRTVLKNASTYDRFYPCYQRTVLDSPDHGTVAFVQVSGAKWDLIYTPANNFVGTDTVVVRYQDRVDQTGKIINKAFVYNYVNSIVTANTDFLLCNKNQQNLSVDPTINDLTSYSGLTLKNVNGLRHVTASKSGNIITYSPETDFVGLAYLNYEVCDAYNTCETGVIQIYVVDPATQPEEDTIYISTAEETNLNIALDLMDYDIIDSTEKGDLFAYPYGILYNPYNNTIGKDTVVIEKNNFTRRIFINILDLPESNNIISPDKVHTAKNTEIIFDVSLNDVKPSVYNYNISLDQGPFKGTLTALNSHGLYRYIPEAGYEGVQTFVYRICPQGICEKATVSILIGDYKPKDNIDYKFSTYKNTPVLLAYDIPIDSYEFSSTDTFLKFYPGWDTISITYNTYCQATFIGYNQLVYYPPYNFADTVNFTVEYCVVGTNSCLSLDCSMNVINEQRNCDRQCVGDCVWPGDVDLNGQVDMKDLLHVGYALGAEGQSRAYNGSSFRALKANNWNRSLRGRALDMKHADTDGDGIIHQNDVNVISNFYHKEHSLIPNPVYERGSFPFELELLNPDVDSGETAFIAIVLGDSSYPVINQAAFSYELDYNIDVVYEPSLQAEFLDQEWFGRGASTVNLYKKPWDGRLESGFVRANGNPVSGLGRTEILSFIVEDDIDVWRRDEEFIKVPFYFKNIIYMNQEGVLVQLEDKTAYLNLGRKKNTNVLDEKKLIIYPNPSSNYVNMHLNGNNEVISYKIFDLQGREIIKTDAVNPKSNQIDVSSLQNGLYLLRVETTLGPISKKIEILK
jgi:hypothetical protein